MNCPRCKVGMQEGDVGGVTIDVCTTCDGSWYDAGELGQIFSLSEEELNSSGLAPTLIADKVMPESDVKLDCPRCSQPMDRFHYLHSSPVVVDGCAEHGVWLDDGELVKILDFISTSGTKLDVLEPEEIASVPRRIVKSVFGMFYRFKN